MHYLKKEVHSCTSWNIFDCKILFFTIQPHLMGKFLYFRQTSLHFAPAIPESVIGICMECSLESSRFLNEALAANQFFANDFNTGS